MLIIGYFAAIRLDPPHTLRVKRRGAARQPPYPLRPRQNRAALAVAAAFSVAIVALLGVFRPAPVEVVIWSSNEKFDLLTEIAAEYNRSSPQRVDRRDVRIKVELMRSGDAESALARDWNDTVHGRKPDVWSPAAETWVLLLQQHREQEGLSEIVPPVSQSIIQSPTVIAMPEPMATALARSRATKPDWKYVLDLAQRTDGWTSLGEPWGPFKFAQTNPRISTSGLHALIATYHAAKRAAGRGADHVTAEDIESEEVRSYARGVERSLAQYEDSVGDFLEGLYAADAQGETLSHFSAIAMEEKQVFDYNRGCPTSRVTCGPEPNIKLVAISPLEGTLVANHPYVVLNWADAARTEAAQNFLQHLETPAVQQIFVDQGFRNHRGQAGDNLKEPYFQRLRTGVLPGPDPAVLVRIQDSWTR